MRIALTLPLLTVLTLPVAAGAAGFTPPEGCTLDLTMQGRGCVVANYYRCDGDAPGDRHSAFADREGVFYVSRIDTETRWMESYSPVTGVTERLVPDAHSHASFSRLLATGRDDFDFAVVGSNGELRRYRGHDQLTGETRVIDGEPLEVTSFAIDVMDGDGNILSSRRGQQFIHRAERLFFGGRDTTTTPGQPDVQSVEDPVSFARPGQPGFGDAKPQYDCDLLMTGAPIGGAG
ncbi:hypothetical protein ACEYYB_07730 [Paracoccus sp. p4-l81]|uniref:hypothetical protein n=1 Tax=unclassified Paracoccus (in: a-proteobacteria) TaxID=2688777 RepID=UPI0035B779AC